MKPPNAHSNSVEYRKKRRKHPRSELRPFKTGTKGAHVNDGRLYMASVNSKPAIEMGRMSQQGRLLKEAFTFLGTLMCNILETNGIGWNSGFRQCTRHDITSM
jgi:hypothetical protein